MIFKGIHHLCPSQVVLLPTASLCPRPARTPFHTRGFSLPVSYVACDVSERLFISMPNRVLILVSVPLSNNERQQLLHTARTVGGHYVATPQRGASVFFRTNGATAATAAHDVMDTWGFVLFLPLAQSATRSTPFTTTCFRAQRCRCLFPFFPEVCPRRERSASSTQDRVTRCHRQQRYNAETVVPAKVAGQVLRF